MAYPDVLPNVHTPSPHNNHIYLSVICYPMAYPDGVPNVHTPTPIHITTTYLSVICYPMAYPEGVPNVHTPTSHNNHIFVSNMLPNGVSRWGTNCSYQHPTRHNNLIFVSNMLPNGVSRGGTKCSYPHPTPHNNHIFVSTCNMLKISLLYIFSLVKRTWLGCRHPPPEY